MQGEMVYKMAFVPGSSCNVVFYYMKVKTQRNQQFLQNVLTKVSKRKLCCTDVVYQEAMTKTACVKTATSAY